MALGLKHRDSNNQCTSKSAPSDSNDPGKRRTTTQYGSSVSSRKIQLGEMLNLQHRQCYA